MRLRCFWARAELQGGLPAAWDNGSNVLSPAEGVWWLARGSDETADGLEQENIRSQMKADAVMEQLPEVSLERGTPAYIRSDSSSEFNAEHVRESVEQTGVKTMFIESWSPWGNGYIESFNGKL